VDQTVSRLFPAMMSSIKEASGGADLSFVSAVGAYAAGIDFDELYLSSHARIAYWHVPMVAPRAATGGSSNGPLEDARAVTDANERSKNYCSVVGPDVGRSSILILKLLVCLEKTMNDGALAVIALPA
jgi:hypothetical protein